jgi:hypothetical protein
VPNKCRRWLGAWLLVGVTLVCLASCTPSSPPPPSKTDGHLNILATEGSLCVSQDKRDRGGLFGLRISNTGEASVRLIHLHFQSASNARLIEADVIKLNRAGEADRYPPRIPTPSEWGTRAVLGDSDATIPYGVTKRLMIAIGRVDTAKSAVVKKFDVDYETNGATHQVSTYRLTLQVSARCS